VLVALHGFSGASIDYENLAKHLLKEQPKSAVYAYEVRGQGRDPKKDRRGDIDDPDNWSVDLLKFTSIVREQHPDARIVWFGESMGGLILSHTYRQQIDAGLKPPCDAIGISSPVVGIRDDFPAWKKELVRGVSKVAPKARITLETLSGGEEVPMTEDSVHSEQSETNSWHVEKHTLRLLVTLGDMIEEMPDCAATFQVPTVVLHGGKDFFTQPEDVEAFADRIPESTPHRRLFYPEGHHLLMYDTVKDEVIADIASWLDSLRK
jgi:alpha-beta hydrolase superfamily lysophospholipase